MRIDQDNYNEPETTTINGDGDVRATGNVLVHYSTNRAGLHFTHREITADNCNKAGASTKALRTVARVFESKDTPIGKMLSLFSTTRGEIAKLGLRLPTGGYLVRCSNLEKVRAIFDGADDQLDRLRGELRRQYDAMVAKSKQSLGSAASGVTFPDPEETASRFVHRLNYIPDPTSGGPLLDGVTEEVAAKVRADQMRLLECAHGTLVKELLSFVTGTGDRDQGILGVLQSDCTIKSSRFTRLAARLKEAKELNYLNLPEVNSTIATLEAIASADLDMVRANPDERRALAKRAEQAVESVTQNSLASLGISI